MKTIRLIVALLAVSIMAGCATSSHNSSNKKVCTPNKVGTHAIAGGALGAVAQSLGVKGAVAAGAFGGIWHGMMKDEEDCEDAELVKSVEARGGNKSPTALRGQANSAEAVELYRECEELKASTSSAYAKREIPDCSYILHKASANGARVETEKLLVKVDGVGSEYGGYQYSSRRARAHARERRALLFDYNRRHYHRRYH